ncbi:hypothetical protein LCGC14_1629990 [marine sediment metagenome]|uniref:Uncharacterized protein n=1 Tax=marine sediment metagenome TaxID=412755 RepID=A0A0F9L2L6_9ZZZZ
MALSDSAKRMPGKLIKTINAIKSGRFILLPSSFDVTQPDYRDDFCGCTVFFLVSVRLFKVLSLPSK